MKGINQKMKSRNFKLITLSTLIITILLIAVWAGCSAKKDIYGEAIATQSVTLIDDLLSKPKDFDGKVVKLEGRIIDECPGGHWFHLKGNKEVIYVTLSGFTLPQKVGKTVSVEGSLISDNGNLSLLGKGVEVK
jgi:hypothetical protein